MKELVIISGKGGTGKTSIVSAFAALSQNSMLCDADVDAADLHLMMNPAIQERHEFRSGHTPAIRPDACAECGLCRDLCRWEAISEDFRVDPIVCEGCGVCHYFCPEKAIDFNENTCGEWYVSQTRFGPMVHARLGVAEENSGKLVTLVRKKARELAEERGLDIILTDGPPGVGCPVIASVGGAGAVLIVAEPSVSGIHDMKRVADLAAHFKVPAIVCVNKYDINPDQSERIENHAKETNLPFAGRVPFDPAFTKSMVLGKTVFEYMPDSNAAREIENIWSRCVSCF